MNKKNFERLKEIAISRIQRNIGVYSDDSKLYAGITADDMPMYELIVQYYTRLVETYWHIRTTAETLEENIQRLSMELMQSKTVVTEIEKLMDGIFTENEINEFKRLTDDIKGPQGDNEGKSISDKIMRFPVGRGIKN